MEDKETLLENYENLKLYSINEQKQILEKVRSEGLKTEEEIEKKTREIINDKNEVKENLRLNCEKASYIEIAEMVDQIESYDKEAKEIIRNEIKRRNINNNSEKMVKKKIRKPIGNFRVFFCILAGIQFFQMVTGARFQAHILAIFIFGIYFLISKIMKYV